VWGAENSPLFKLLRLLPISELSGDIEMGDYSPDGLGLWLIELISP